MPNITLICSVISWLSHYSFQQSLYHTPLCCSLSCDTTGTTAGSPPPATCHCFRSCETTGTTANGPPSDMPLPLFLTLLGRRQKPPQRHASALKHVTILGRRPMAPPATGHFSLFTSRYSRVQASTKEYKADGRCDCYLLLFSCKQIQSRPKV